MQKQWVSDIDLIVDSMALYKETMWDPKTKSYVGLVDYGMAKPEHEKTSNRGISFHDYWDFTALETPKSIFLGRYMF